LDDPKALGYAERAVKLAPNNAAVLDTYGTLLVKNGEADKGLPFLEQARRLAPSRNDLRLNYAKALIRPAGRARRARNWKRCSRQDNFSGKEEVPGY